MALVGDPELLSSAGPGRVRELVVGLYRRCLAEPHRAGALLSGAQREFRSLRSRQRRPALDALYDLVRHDALLRVLTGSEDPAVLWVGLLVKQGLDPSEARASSELEVDFGRCADWDAQVAAERSARDAVDGLGLYAGVDRAVAEALLERFELAEATRFVDASNQRAPVTLRANRARTTRATLLAALAREGIEARAGQWSEDAVILDGRAQLQTLPEFKKGHFEVQDEGSQLLAALVQAQGVVVDFCAGAGGKTLALAATRPQRLLAFDTRKPALVELDKRAKRARVEVEIHGLDREGRPPRELRGLRADRVLVDAPCDGIGVLRRHPEHRWMVDRQRLEWLAGLQAAILDRAAKLVAPGGRLIYGTCSVLPVENRAVVTDFLGRNPAFGLLPATEVLGADFGEYLETSPHSHGTDGFFGAVLQRG